MENFFNLNNPEDLNRFSEVVDFLKKNKQLVELKLVKRTRTNLQNRALHLFFENCAEAKNDAGDYYVFLDDYNKVQVEIPWTGNLFKERWIKPIIKDLYGYHSTTQLKTNEIDPILDVIINRFASDGISVYFPSRFNMWINRLS